MNRNTHKMILTKKISLAILIIVSSTNISFAQSIKEAKLSLTWEIKASNYQSSGETFSELSLENIGESSLPASGWDIYFNSPPLKPLDENSSAFKITHINGDFFKLSPNKLFKGILAKQNYSIKLLTRILKNITDYPKGFYMVYENAPQNPVVLNLVTKPTQENSAQERALANDTYMKNSLLLNENLADLAPILPSPISFKNLEGNFILNDKIKIVSSPFFFNEANYLANQIKTIIGIKPLVSSVEEGQTITLRQDKNIPTEGYELSITPSKIVITASDNAGSFYGIQSLKNLLPAQVWKTKSSSISLKSMIVKDSPMFPHRAFMMEIARNFLPKSQIMKTLDLLALYKMNIMHLHFNDDEGWRIEIKDLPELTDVGSKRGHTLTELDRLIPAYGSGPFTENAAGSGYLTRADFIAILKYAKERHITIIPEYETPGHARAAIKSMDARYHRFMKEGKPEDAKKYLLRDLNDQSKYESIQGFTDNIINPALPSVYNFIEKITDETIAMYKEAGATLKTIHFGGDEVPAGVWEHSPLAKALVTSNSNVKNIDELWQYYFSKVNDILKSRNLYLSGWEEIGLKKSLVDGKKVMVLDHRFANQNYHADVWNNMSGNEDLAYKLANAGYKVVLTNVTNLYLDLAYNKSYNEPGQYWGGYVDVDKPFKFIPLNYYKNQKEDKSGRQLPKNFFDTKVNLTKSGEANIIGLQAPLWSEIITSKERFEYLLLPKLLGVAERSWAQNPAWAMETDLAKSEALYQKAWGHFVNLIGTKELEKLDNYAGGFNYRIPSPGYIVENNQIKANVLYPDLTIRYTEDGTEPSVKSKIFNFEIPYKENVKIKVFNKEGRSSTSVTISGN